ncbi:MAG: TetR/AcrR family transcriptional regulator [Acidimicrobiales bacterium]
MQGRQLRVDARRNRERLLDVALQAFTDHGVTASLDDIARRAGVGIGTLYRHFPSRDALIDALIGDGVDDLCEMGAELVDASDPLDALTRWLRALVDHAARFRGLAASITAAAPTTYDGALANSCASVNAAGSALMAQARAAGVLRDDVADADIIDLTASIAWIREHAPRDDGQIDRLLGLVIDAITVSTDHAPRDGRPTDPARSRR